MAEASGCEHAATSDSDGLRMEVGVCPPQVNRIEEAARGSKQFRPLLPRPDLSLLRAQSHLGGVDHATFTPHGKKRTHMELDTYKTDQTDQQSTEDDIVETLSNMNNTAKHFGRQKNSGKGVLKIQCSLCSGPIAVKVSKALRARNDDSVESQKMCQKCFSMRMPRFIGKEIANVVKKSVMNNYEFPWWTNQSKYFESELEPCSLNWSVGDRFSVVYTYCDRGQHSGLEGKIKLNIYVVKVRDDGFINIGASSCQNEYMIMKQRLGGKDPYIDVKTLLRPGSQGGQMCATWTWNSVPRVVLDHMKMVSQMQSQAGSFTVLAATFEETNPLNGSVCVKEVFVTNHDKLVVYPYENFLDFDVHFGEAPVRMTNVATGKEALVNKSAFDSDMVKIVATDSRGKFGYIRLQYVTFEISSSGTTVREFLTSLYLRCDIHDLVSLCGLEKYTSFSNSERMQSKMFSVSVAYASEFFDVFAIGSNSTQM